MFKMQHLEKHEEYITAFAILCDGLIVTHKITRRWIAPRPDPNSEEAQRKELILYLGGMGNHYFESSHYGVEFPSTNIQIVGKIFYSSKDQDGFKLAQEWMDSIGEHPKVANLSIPTGRRRIQVGAIWSSITERIPTEGEIVLEHPAGEFWKKNKLSTEG